MITREILVNALSAIALRLEKEAQDNTFSDDLVSVRNRSVAKDSLATVQRILGDDWVQRQLWLGLTASERVRQEDAA